MQHVGCSGDYQQFGIRETFGQQDRVFRKDKNVIRAGRYEGRDIDQVQSIRAVVATYRSELSLKCPLGLLRNQKQMP